MSELNEVMRDICVARGIKARQGVVSSPCSSTGPGIWEGVEGRSSYQTGLWRKQNFKAKIRHSIRSNEVLGMVGESPEHLEDASGYTYKTVWKWRRARPSRAETSVRLMSITEMKNRSQHGSEDRIMLYLLPRILFPSFDSYRFSSTFPLGYSIYVSVTL